MSAGLRGQGLDPQAREATHLAGDVLGGELHEFAEARPVASGGVDERRSEEEAGAIELGDVTVVPGFIDMHVHGGGSHSFSEGPEAATSAARFHLGHGTTSLLASLASAPLDELATQTVGLRPLVEAGVLAGLHIEGPFLNECRRGAHNPELLMDPDVEWLLEVVDNGVKMVTLAPELAGGLAAMDRRLGRVRRAPRSGATLGG